MSANDKTSVGSGSGEAPAPDPALPVGGLVGAAP